MKEEKELEQEQLEKLSEEDEKFLNGHPTRTEVANYVNALFEEKYMPQITKAISQVEYSAKLSITTLQALLVQKGICVEDEILKTMTSIVEACQKDLMNKQPEQPEETTKTEN